MSHPQQGSHQPIFTLQGSFQLPCPIVGNIHQKRQTGPSQCSGTGSNPKARWRCWGGCCPHPERSGGTLELHPSCRRPLTLDWGRKWSPDRRGKATGQSTYLFKPVKSVTRWRLVSPGTHLSMKNAGEIQLVGPSTLVMMPSDKALSITQCAGPSQWSRTFWVVRIFIGMIMPNMRWIFIGLPQAGFSGKVSLMMSLNSLSSWVFKSNIIFMSFFPSIWLVWPLLLPSLWAVSHIPWLSLLPLHILCLLLNLLNYLLNRLNWHYTNCLLLSVLCHYLLSYVLWHPKSKETLQIFTPKMFNLFGRPRYSK